MFKLQNKLKASMKKTATLLFSMAFALFLGLLFACNGGDSGSNVPRGVYVAGLEYIGTPENATRVAMLWKDGEVYSRLGNEIDPSCAYSVHISGNDVYVAGYTFANGRYIATLWKNSEAPLYLTGPARNSYALSVCVAGGRVCVAGYVAEDADQIYGNAGVLWVVDGNRNVFYAYTYNEGEFHSVIAQGNTVYVAGREWDSYNRRSVATVYSANVSGDLYLNYRADWNYSTEAYSVYVSGSDIYAAGTVYNGSRWSAALWKNDIAPIVLDGTSDGVRSYDGYSVWHSGGDVYVGGRGLDSNDYTRAMMWKNNTPQLLPARSNGNSAVHSIFVSGKDVYAAGYGYSGNIATVWKNGQLLQEIHSSSAGMASYSYSIFVK
ncbi:MAG: hypothetical protein LBH03_03750 [Holophagales bacterium]|jgi:hypothetical protein|nr:hypothetical protein [Holophagales bacterium]